MLDHAIGRNRPQNVAAVAALKAKRIADDFGSLALRGQQPFLRRSKLRKRGLRWNIIIHYLEILFLSISIESNGPGGSRGCLGRSRQQSNPIQYGTPETAVTADCTQFGTLRA